MGVRNTALNLLARREHSALELSNKLKKRGFSGSEIDSIIDKLIQENLLSDRRFAEAYIHARSSKGFGPLRIESELKERGVKESIINELLDINDDTWLEVLENLYHRKYLHKSQQAGELAPVDYKDKAKQIRFLQYRGFSLEKIHEVVK